MMMTHHLLLKMGKEKTKPQLQAVTRHLQQVPLLQSHSEDPLEQLSDHTAMPTRTHCDSKLVKKGDVTMI